VRTLVARHKLDPAAAAPAATAEQAAS